MSGHVINCQVTSHPFWQTDMSDTKCFSIYVKIIAVILSFRQFPIDNFDIEKLFINPLNYSDVKI